MWPLPSHKKNDVTVLLLPDRIICINLAFCKKQQRFSLNAYSTTMLDRHEALDGALFNLTAIQDSITTFLHQHRLRHAYIHLVVAGNQIIQKTASYCQATPAEDEITAFHVDPNSLVWAYRYLYPNNDATHTFYVSGIPHWLLLRYKLLAIKSKLNLINITPHYSSILMLYCWLHRATFSHTAFSKAMAAANSFDDLISKHHLAQLFTSPLPDSHISYAAGIHLGAYV